MGFVRFERVREAVFGFAFVVSAVILIMVAYQASIFLTNGTDKAWIIFGLVVSSLTIVSAAMLSLKYSFKTHIVLIGLLAALWLAFAAYTTDRIGYISCESLDGTTRSTSPGHKAYDNVSWCRQTKAVQGLSWFNFALMMIAVISWIRLQEEEEKYAGFRDTDNTSDRASYRAAEVFAREQEETLRRRGYGQYAVGTPAPAQVLTTTGFNTGVPTTYYPAQQPVYTQTGQPLVVQGGQIVNRPMF